MSFSIRLFDTGGTVAIIPPDMTVTPNRWSWSHWGGPENADVAIAAGDKSMSAALDWVGYRIDIIDDQTVEPVWWGFIESVRWNWGSNSVGRSLAGVANKVRVKHNYTDSDGTQIAAVTAWAEDSASQSDYGVKEKTISLADATVAAAEELRNQELDRLAWPKVSLGTGGGRPGGLLTCRGWYSRAGWETYSNNAGRIEHSPSGGTTQTLGLGVTATDIAFTANRIHSIGADFTNFDEDVKLTITGTSSNNGVRTINTVDSREQESYTGTDVSTETSDDIKVTSRNFGFIRSGDLILVSGFTTGNHNGDHLVKDPGEAHIEITTGYSNTLANESAGNSVTVTRGQYMETDVAGSNERDGTSFTLTAHGEMVAQKFNNNTGSAWTADRIAVQLQNVGSPTDDITVGLYSDSGGSIGTLLDSGTIDDADIGSAASWFWVDLSNTDSLADSTDYWIRISRAGSNDPDDLYRVGIHETDLYGDGELEVYDGSTWYTRAVDADMKFRVWGAVDTSVLMDDMLDNQTHWGSVNVDVTTNVEVNQYRDGNRTIRAELEDLLAMGTSSDGYLVVRVDERKNIVVEDAQAKAANRIDWHLQTNGTVTDVYEQDARGHDVSAAWASLVGLSDADASLDGIRTVYIEWAEYEARRGTYRYRERGAQSLL